jgi:hypothetical protein
MPHPMLYARAKPRLLVSSLIAVTFGTATSSSIDAGFKKPRFEAFSLKVK